MHGTRWVVGGYIERFEVVVIIFDLWAFYHFKADGGKETFDAFDGASNRV